MKKKRVDQLLVEGEFAQTLKEATALLLAGKVRVNQEPVRTAGSLIPVDAQIFVEEASRYVSRGGYKLEAALDHFDLSVVGKICADVGASTGGFTDALLQYGARKVYAIDVGYGDLAWKLRNDPAVVVLERTNARHIEKLPEPVSVVVIDASFISLKRILTVVANWTGPQADIVALVKPQFEAPKDQVETGGVVKSRQTHAAILEDMMSWVVANQMSICGLIASPLTGPAGNREFLLHIITDQDAGKKQHPESFKELIQDCLNTLD